MVSPIGFVVFRNDVVFDCQPITSICQSITSNSVVYDIVLSKDGDGLSLSVTDHDLAYFEVKLQNLVTRLISIDGPYDAELLLDVEFLADIIRRYKRELCMSDQQASITLPAGVQCNTHSRIFTWFPMQNASIV